MRLRLTLAFLLMGFSFTILQTVLVRELLVSFSGNELSIGLVLGAWLVLEAVGSGAAGLWLKRSPRRPTSYATLQLLLALFLLPTFWAALRVRALLGAVPGEAIGPLPALLGALLALAPLGLIDGAMFATACAVLLAAWEQVSPERESSRVYILEACGSILGGATFTFLLLPALPSTCILFLVGGLNAASATSLLLGSVPRPRPAALGAALLATGALTVALAPAGSRLHGHLVSGRWAPSRLAYEANSPYGNIAALREQNQVTILVNGAPVLTAPDPDIAGVEEMTHLPALFLDQPPQHVLIVGGGAGGVLHELLRYPVKRIDYAELDPLLIRVLHAFPNPLTSAELQDPRVALATVDGRRFVASLARSHASSYDLILVNLPYPSTLVVNRLYTEEFYRQIAGLLAPEGILAIPAPPGRTYVAPSLRELLACQRRTLLRAFPHVRAVPGDEMTLWLASRRALDLPVEELVRRWEERGLETRMLRPEHLHYLFDPRVGSSFEAALEEADVAVNRDAYPVGLRYGLAYESAILSPELEPFFRWLGRLRVWHLGVGLAALLLVGLVALRRPETLVPSAIATTGVAGMTTDLLVLFAFQLRYGYVYQHVGLLVTSFMAGLALGGLAMRAWIGKGRIRRPWGTFLWLEAAVASGMALLVGGIALLLSRPTPAPPVEPLVLYVANLVGGILVGLEFPLATRLLVARGEQGVQAASFLYAWDLAGATVGAVLVSAILLPALGLLETALLVALLKGVSLTWIGSRFRTVSSP
ncbi:MAG: hypothetical protein ACP5SI_03545 [Chloroflexia bacterium]